MRYTLYGLRPDRRFIGYYDDRVSAEREARVLVDHYPDGCEVWMSDPGGGIPVFAVWREHGKLNERRRKED